jgi:hypothetical protein
MWKTAVPSVSPIAVYTADFGEPTMGTDRHSKFQNAVWDHAVTQ